MTTSKQPAEESLTRPVLELKNFSISDPDTERIYKSTREAVERFNIYVEDFFQTREILREQIQALGRNDDRKKLKEFSESLEQVTMRIDEMRTSMEEMARHMGSFVDLKCE